MPSVFCGSEGQVTYVVLTFADTISSTLLAMSSSVMRLMWPLRTAARTQPELQPRGWSVHTAATRRSPQESRAEV